MRSISIALALVMAFLLTLLLSGCGGSSPNTATNNGNLNSAAAGSQSNSSVAAAPTPGEPTPSATPTLPGATPTATPTPNGSSTVVSNIQSDPNWVGCGTCADPGGVGAEAPFSFTMNEANPSLDGASTQFWLGGTVPYTNALFTNHLGGRAGASNFILDFDLYVGNAPDAQALEFDIFYARDGIKNYFLTECDTNGMYAGTWQVQNIVLDTWVHTGLPCQINSNAWNHVTLQFDREADSSTRFISASMNGDTQYINQIYASEQDSGFEMTAGVQLDGNSKQTNFSIWVDQMSITYW